MIHSFNFDIADILYKRSLGNQLTAQEETALQQFIAQNPKNAELVNRKPEQWQPLLQNFAASVPDKEALYAKILQRTPGLTPYRRRWTIKKTFTASAYHNHHGILSRLLRFLRIIPRG